MAKRRVNALKYTFLILVFLAAFLSITPSFEAATWRDCCISGCFRIPGGTWEGSYCCCIGVGTAEWGSSNSKFPGGDGTRDWECSDLLGTPSTTANQQCWYDTNCQIVYDGCEQNFGAVATCDEITVGQPCAGGTCSSTCQCIAGTFKATFSQSGVPAGTTWGVTVGGTRYTSTSSSLDVLGLSGTVAYTYDSTVPGTAGTQYVCTTDCLGSVTSGSPLASASYKTQYQLEMSVNMPSYGTISPDVGTYWYDANTELTISATPKTGYNFIQWTGTGTTSYTGSLNSHGIKMETPISEYAQFTGPGTACSSLLNYDACYARTTSTKDCCWDDWWKKCYAAGDWCCHNEACNKVPVDRKSTRLNSSHTT